MSKYCGNCGALLEDDAKVCGYCGYVLESTNAPEVDFQPADPEKLARNKKKIKRVITLAIIAVAAIIAFNVISSFVGKKGFVRKVMSACEKYNVDSLISMSSGVYADCDDSVVQSYFETHAGGYIDTIEENVGHNYKLSYKINEIYDLSDRKESTLMTSIGYAYPKFDTSEIKKIAIADVSLTAKQGSKKTKINVKITMTKEGNSWKLLYLEQ